ncbi:EAL domain-containing protein [Candidatus Peregrinibacteria bacterium]|nr:EAL domain-containing protein [Candidatus Peregrinibacteria bacterium]
MRRVSVSGGTSMFGHDESTEQIRTAFEEAFPELPADQARALVNHVSTEPGEDMSTAEFLRCMTEERLYPVFQGFRDVETKQLWGGEMLARILSEDGTLTCAERFKKAASQTHMWPEISRRTMESGMHVASCMPENVAVSFNVGGELLDQAHFADELQAMRKIHGATDRRICLEAVEDMTTLLKNGRSATLRRCSANNVQFLADDVGQKRHDRGMAQTPEGADSAQNADKLLEQLTMIVGVYGIKLCGAVTDTASKVGGRIRRCIEQGKRLGVSRFIAEGSERYPINNQIFLGLQRLQGEYGERIELSVQGPVFRV